MANKALKSIKFPGLSDTYTVPEIDSTLTGSGKAADAKVVGDQLGDLKSAVTNAEGDIDALQTAVPGKVNKPVSSPNGTSGQLLRTNGDGTTTWVDQGLPTDAQTAEAVSDWLDDHPEATTTVQDGSLTEAKFSAALAKKAVKDYVTPQMFGAVGDGANDDTSAFVAALEHDYVFVPEGAYKITSTIAIPDYTKFIGARNAEISFTGQTSAFSVGNYAEIGNLNIDCNGNADGILLDGGRALIHDCTITNANKGIYTGSHSTNLSYIERIRITDCDTGIDIQNNNDGNSQSMSISDIDIRGCTYGITSVQPANKFFNICVQHGLSGGNAVVLHTGADNNIFYGTYFENPNYEYEVVFDGAKYNEFRGGRVVQYIQSFDGNDGTNIIATRSTQLNTALFEFGNHYFESCGVPSKYGTNNNPAAVVKMTYDSENTIRSSVEGTSARQRIKWSGVDFKSDDLTFFGGLGSNNTFSNITLTVRNQSNVSIQAGKDIAFSAGNIIPTEDTHFLVSCEYHGIVATIKPNGTTNMDIHLWNISGNDINNATVPIVIMAFKAGAGS